MKKKKKLLFPVVSLLLIAFLIALPGMIERSKDALETSDRIRSSVVSVKDIPATLSGTGTLAAEDSEEIEVPDGVEVTEYFVSNGDHVVKGQPLVAVDRVSVQNAILTCRETMDYLEKQMFALEYNEATRYIMVPANGTVKEIYCKAGDRVADVMLEHGCLAIIDINGSEWRAQAFTGTVKYVNAYVGENVYAHSSFIWLDDLADSSEYDTCLSEYHDYEELMEKLFKMYTDGAVTAPCDGMISGIDTDEVKKLQDISDPVLLDKLTELEKPTDSMPPELPDVPFGTEGSFIPGELPEDFSPGERPEQELPEGFSPGDPPDQERLAEPGTDSEEKIIPAEPAAAMSGIGGRTVVTGTDLVYSGEKPEAVPTEKTANIPGGIRGGNSAPGGLPGSETEPGTDEFSALTPKYEDGVLSFYDGETDVTDKVKFPTGSLYAYKMGDFYAVIDNDPQQLEALKQQMMEQMKSMMEGQMKSMMGMMSGMMAGMSGAGASEEESFEKYPLEGKTVMTVTPQEKVTVEITIDELDILSVEVGQDAVITIDAIPGKSYSGRVTKVNSAATVNAGGQTKYSAVVTMDMDDELLAGMNATTLITVSMKENVLTIPARALVEKSGKTFVYTSYDEQEKTLSGLKEVVTGVSDGEDVEILSGLAEGDTVRYEYEDTIDVSDVSANPGLSMANMMNAMY